MLPQSFMALQLSAEALCSSVPPQGRGWGGGWGTPDVARMRVRTTPVETYSGRTPAIGEFPQILCWVVYPSESDTDTKCLPQGLIDDTGFPLNIHLLNWLN